MRSVRGLSFFYPFIIAQTAKKIPSFFEGNEENIILRVEEGLSAASAPTTASRSPSPVVHGGGLRKHWTLASPAARGKWRAARADRGAQRSLLVVLIIDQKMFHVKHFYFTGMPLL